MMDTSTATTQSPQVVTEHGAPALSQLTAETGWLASRYADVQSALSDDRLEVPEAPPSEEVGTVAWLRASVSRFANGTIHKQRRAQVIEQLQALDVAALRSAAFQRASDSLDVAGQFGPEIEVMSLLARRVPLATLAAALGFATPERAAEASIAAAGPYLFPSDDALARSRADAAVSELLGMVEAADLEPTIAKIQLLVHTCDATAGLIGAGLMHLLIAADAACGWSTEALLTEVARYSPPLRAMRRVATTEVNIQECAVSPGDTVLCSIEAANRDPAVFYEPDRFDPTRRQRPTMTFGYGVRPCPGSAHALVLAIGVVAAVRERCSITGPHPIEWEASALQIPRAVTVVLR